MDKTKTKTKTRKNPTTTTTTKPKQTKNHYKTKLSTKFSWLVTHGLWSTMPEAPRVRKKIFANMTPYTTVSCPILRPSKLYSKTYIARSAESKLHCELWLQQRICNSGHDARKLGGRLPCARVLALNMASSGAMLPFLSLSLSLLPLSVSLSLSPSLSGTPSVLTLFLSSPSLPPLTPPPPPPFSPSLSFVSFPSRQLLSPLFQILSRNSVNNDIQFFLLIGAKRFYAESGTGL